jgi:hypothetical protein
MPAHPLRISADRRRWHTAAAGLAAVTVALGLSAGAADAQPVCDPPQQDIERPVRIAVGTATFTDQAGEVVASRSGVLLSDPITAAAGNAILAQRVESTPPLDVSSLTPFVDPDAGNVAWIQGTPPPYPTSADNRLLTRLRAVPFETTNETIDGPEQIASFTRTLTTFPGTATINGVECAITNTAVVRVTVVEYRLTAERASGAATTTPTTTAPSESTTVAPPVTTVPPTSGGTETTSAAATTSTALPHAGDARGAVASGLGVLFLGLGFTILRAARRERHLLLLSDDRLSASDEPVASARSEQPSAASTMGADTSQASRSRGTAPPSTRPTSAPGGSWLVEDACRRTTTRAGDGAERSADQVK